MTALLLKEVYHEMFQETRFDGVLYEIENAIMSHNWGLAKAAIHEARELKVPEGILHDTVSSAFQRHFNHFKDIQSEMISL